MMSRPCFDSRRWVLLAGFACGLLMIGCDDGKPKTAKVTGRVTYNGQSLSEGQIVFVPSSGRSAFGKIKDSEIVDVSTFGKGDGVILGRAQVGIKCVTNMFSMEGQHDELSPKQYNDPEKSGLTVDVKPNGPNEFNIDLTD
jgi:hypothetical protein